MATRQTIVQERMKMDAVFSLRQLEKSESENKALRQAKQNKENEIIYLKSQIESLQKKLDEATKRLSNEM